MKKVLISIIFFVMCFICVGGVHALTIPAPKITGVEYPNATSLKIKYNTNNTNSNYKILVYNMTSGKLVKQAINTTSYTFTGLETGKVYNFKTRIYYLEGSKPYTSSWSNIVSASPKADTVTIKSLTGSNNQAVVSYSTTGKPSGVEIYVKELGKNFKTTNLTSYTITGLTNGKTYNITARTYYSNGAYGDWSSPKSVTISNSISSINISQTAITGINSSYVWLAKVVSPVPKITYNGKELKQNVDYTLEYANNKEPGVAKVTISGKGTYTGTVTKSFKIYVGDTTGMKKTKSKSKGYHGIITLSGRTFILYTQRYSGKWNGGESISGSGCGPRAAATIISGYGYNMNTKQFAQNSTKYNRKYRKSIDGSKSARGLGNMYYMQSLGFSAKSYRMKKMSVSAIETTMRTALQKGHQIWFQVGPGSLKFTKHSHNIAILSIDVNGTYVYTSDKGWKKLSEVVKNRYKGSKALLVEVWKPL